MEQLRKWKVTISAWDVMEVNGIEAETEEGAKEIALEWMHDDFNVDHIDGGVNTIEAEAEEE